MAVSLVRPIAVLTLPVMIAALVSVLQARPALFYVYYGFPAALALAMLWTHFDVRMRTAEIHVRDGEVAFRSIWEAAGTPLPLEWETLFEVRRTPHSATIACGVRAVELDREAWPGFDDLLETLSSALHSEPEVS
jgi:hypothetical protein